MSTPNVLDSHGALYRQATEALDDLAQAREAAAAGRDALRAVLLLRGLLGLVMKSADAAADPHWQMAGLILASVPAADTDTPATITGGTR